MADNKRLAILASGSGSNLQVIIDSIQSNELKNTEIAIVISNKENAFALTRSKEAGIKTEFINPEAFENNLAYDKYLIEIINSYNVDLIILAGYLKILSSEFVKAFENKIINIHPALLPAFGGKGMYGQKVHEAVIKSKTKESGCTTHFVTSEVDAGQIILQRKVPVFESDTAKTLSERILKEEHKLLVESIKTVLENKVLNK